MKEQTPEEIETKEGIEEPLRLPVDGCPKCGGEGSTAGAMIRCTTCHAYYDGDRS